MGVVDIGLRLLLEDLASGGLNSFTGLLRDLVSFAAHSATGADAFTAAIERQQLAIAESEDKLVAYGDAMDVLALKSAAAEAELEATRIATEDLNNLPTQSKIDAVAQEVQVYEADLASLETQLNSTKQAIASMQAQGLDTTAEEAEAQRLADEMVVLQAKIADCNSEMQLLTDQGILQNEAAMARAEATAQSYQNQISDLQQKISDEKQALYDANLALDDMKTKQEEAAVQATNLKTAVGLIGGGAVGLGIFGSALNAVVKDASDLGDALTNLKIAFNLSDQQAQAMEQTLIHVASNSKFTTAQVADGFTSLAEHGRSAADVVQSGMGQAMVNFAEAVKSDTVPAAELLSSAMTIFGADASQATDYASMLTYAFYNGIPSVDQLGQVIQDAGAKAASLNIPMNQLLTTMTYLTKSGLSASTAADSLRYMLDTLTSPTDKAAKELSYLGLETINNVTPAFQSFQAKLDAAAAASKQSAVQFDGTLTSLKDMYTQAEKLGTMRTDMTFMQWATSLGIVSNKLYDSQGNMLPLYDLLEKLGGAIDKLPDPEQKAEAINAIFNVRSGKDANVLFNNLDKLKQYLHDTDAAMQNFAGGNGVSKDAQAQNSTLSARWAELSTTIHDMLGQVGTPLTQFFAGLVHNFNLLIAGIDMTNPKTQQFISIMLMVGLGLSVIAVVAGLVVFAFTGIGAAIMSFLAPILLVVAAILILAPLFTAIGIAIANFLKSSNPFAEFLRGIGTAIGMAVQDALKFWGVIQNVFNPPKGGDSQLGQALGQLGQALQSLWKIVQPVFMGLAALLGGTLVGLFSGLVAGLSMFVAGLVHLITGIVLIVTGYLNTFIGFIKMFLGLFIGLFTGNWSMFNSGWTQFLKGLLQIGQGMLQAILGVFLGTFGTIGAFIGGFVQGIINFFTHLADVLVHHSIIPDMLKAILTNFTTYGLMIVTWLTGWITGLITSFTQLGVRVLAAGQSMWAALTTAFQGGVGGVLNLFLSLPGRIIAAIASLGSMLVTAGFNAMMMFANGITSGIGWVTNAVTNVANQVKHFLGFASPPKGGPLADSDSYMPNMMQMYGQGILKNMHHVTGAVTTVARAMNPTQFTTPMTQASLGYAGAGSGVNGTTTVNLNVDGKQMGQVVLDRVSGQLVMNGINRALR